MCGFNQIFRFFFTPFFVSFSEYSQDILDKNNKRSTHKNKIIKENWNHFGTNSEKDLDSKGLTKSSLGSSFVLLTFDLFDDVEPALTRLELLLGFELAVAGADSNILLSDESLLSNTNVADLSFFE